MTTAFGRRNRAIAPPPPPAKPQVVLTPEQRASLFAGEPETGAAQSKFDAEALDHPHLRRAAWLSCAVMTALAVALTQFGKPHDSLAALPSVLAPMGETFVGMMGPWGGPMALAWSIFIIAANLGSNLWLTRQIGAFAGWRGLAPYLASGAGVSVAIAFGSALLGLGESEIGYGLEALTGAGVAGLYRLLSGARTL